MDINNIITEARKRPDTTIALPMRRNKAGRVKFFSIFECQRCGSCCTSNFKQIEFSEADFNRIRRKLPQGGRSKFKKVGKSYITSANPCLFYSKKRGCTIYEDRPIRCRRYPTGFVIPDAPNNLAVHTGCPSACDAIKKAWDMAGLYGVRP